MKFGKHIQKRQLEIPEYAANFVDYKALKKLIKALSATPVLPAQSHVAPPAQVVDASEALVANKAAFFFRLDRELEKVNKFYLIKEADLKMRLSQLMEQKKTMQALQPPASKSSSRYIALEEGFRTFGGDLSKLQQFIEVNQTAFSKILKKWDKASKQEMKVRFLSRAVEVEPCFNRDIISELSDQATANLLDFAAWGEGERMQYTMTNGGGQDLAPRSLAQDDADLDSQIYQAIAAGNLDVLRDWVSRISAVHNAQQRITKAFLSAAEEAPEAALNLLLETDLVDLQEIDEINHRNILHRAAISGREFLLQIGLNGNVDVRAVDVYGRIPLHYACMHGSEQMVQRLLGAGSNSIDLQDHDKFTALIHAVVRSQLAVVKILLANQARIDPTSESDHVPLNLACQHGSIPVVQELLKRRPKILPDAEGLYPQHLVARSPKAPQLLLMLRDYGADLDQPDKLYQWTPLFHAASEGNVECLQTLLDSGVDPNIVDEKGLSVLYYATWEGRLDCMRILASKIGSPNLRQQESSKSSLPPPVTPSAKARDADTIPLFVLPPPIIPIRRYGHNFLESKTYVMINFGDLGYDAIQFYDDNKYPAARLTIASKSSDLIPGNLLLPIQDDYRVSFQIDSLENFAIDFDVYPTFGARVIARARASSTIFTSRSSSSGICNLELWDPRLRAIGRLDFSFQVVKPFSGVPLEITHFATYWIETDQQPHNSSLVTGSSLSGDYVRLYVQMTADGVPVLYPRWKVTYGKLNMPLMGITYDEFSTIREDQGIADLQTALAQHPELDHSRTVSADDLPALHNIFATSYATLEEALAILPNNVNIELHILYPSQAEETQLRLGSTLNLNDFADGVLKVVFDHARAMRVNSNGFLRSIVFSSFNSDICTALNWKQPNYPVLFCDEIGAETTPSSVLSSGRTMLSVKEAVQLAQNNNFMGLICSSRLLDLAPPLIESIKTAGLVLISDVSGLKPPFGPRGVPDGVDGTVKGNGVLHFNDSVDM